MQRLFRAAISAALFLFTLTGLATAQDVELRSLDGSVELSGTLIGFDGEFYRLDTIFGPLTVVAQGVSCAGPGCPDLENFVAELRLSGAPAITRTLLPALIESFARERGMLVEHEIRSDDRSVYTLRRRADETIAARFTVTTSSSAEGLRALIDRETDIALSLREPTPGERATAREAGQGELADRSRVLGLDALVPVVAPSNPLHSISLADLAAVFSGAIDNWSDLGGADASIVLHLPASGSGLAQSFADTVLAPANSLADPEVFAHDTVAALADAVARDPFAIGVTRYSATGNSRVLDLRGPCGFRQTASPDSLKTEDFPLTAPLVAYLPVRRMPQLVREFFGFMESQSADRVVRRSGFVNQAITSIPLDAQGQRLANAIASAGDEVALADLQALVDGLDGAERLSPTFRFGGGSTSLDAQSRSAVARLAAAIERGRFDGRELIFVGFSDGQGPADSNQRLSRVRADAVRLAVVRAAVAADLNRLDMRVDAYGEALPMACDDGDRGRAVNRRVEVWLR